MTFTCLSLSRKAVNLTFANDTGPKSWPGGEDGTVSAVMNPYVYAFQHVVQSKNVTVTCAAGDDDDGEACTVNVISISQDPGNCNDTGEKDGLGNGLGNDGVLSCDPTQWNEENSARRTSHSAFIGTRGDFETVLRYSYYYSDNSTWIDCAKTDADGKELFAHKSRASHTKTIRCPIVFKDKPQAVVIRISASTLSAGVASGIVFQGPSPKFTYIEVAVNSIVPLDDEDDDHSMVSVVVIGVLVAVIAVLLMLFGALYLVKRKKKNREKGSSTFYKDMVLVGRVAEEPPPKRSDVDDEVSLGTETTTAYDRTRNVSRDIDTNSILGLFSANEFDVLFNDKKQNQIDRRKMLLQRQLSGDPSKINPELTINQQVNILSYDPKRELDRCNFTVGKLLGSGNYGSVWEGMARGLLYPGSSNKVAIKTVNNELDHLQFISLMSEMKILGHLDLHPNLVNLLGSCTAEMDDCRLWLLLEYCARGDLKTFLVNNRQELRNSIGGVIATELDSRLLLTWAHSIAKGMEYLSSKRIMHGDLAARNVLLDQNNVAKVSDFGLSKAMYDNVGYKKNERSDVPWKWMAVEFLMDGCFTLKSDVWSYGIVLWEMFTLGQEPYCHQGRDDTIRQIHHGYRLQFPDESLPIDWAATVFEKVMRPSWMADVRERIDFGGIVDVLEGLMDVEEKGAYARLVEENDSLKNLLFDDATRSKRSTLSPRESLNPSSPPAAGSYHKLFSLGGRDGAEMATGGGYIPVQEVQQGGASEEADDDARSYIQMKVDSDPATVPPQSGYMSLSQATGSSTKELGGGGCYVPLAQAISPTTLAAVAMGNASYVTVEAVKRNAATVINNTKNRSDVVAAGSGGS
jgi:serine/threonine protein kinase